MTSKISVEAKKSEFMVSNAMDDVTRASRKALMDYLCKMYYVPCYSSQNGYYTTEVDIYYNGKCVCNTEGEWIDE